MLPPRLGLKIANKITDNSDAASSAKNAAIKKANKSFFSFLVPLMKMLEAQPKIALNRK